MSRNFVAVTSCLEVIRVFLIAKNFAEELTLMLAQEFLGNTVAAHNLVRPARLNMVGLNRAPLSSTISLANSASLASMVSRGLASSLVSLAGNKGNMDSLASRAELLEVNLECPWVDKEVLILIAFETSFHRPFKLIACRYSSTCIPLIVCRHHGLQLPIS